jgi:hypothetical protein
MLRHRVIIAEANKRETTTYWRVLTECFALLTASLLFSSPSIAQHHADMKAVGEAPHYAAQQLLPIRLSLAGKDASVVDLQFCGSKGASGSMIAIIIPGIAEPVLTLDALSCSKSADSIAKNFLATHSDTNWVAVDYAGASWSNFRISITSGKTTVYLRDLSTDSMRSQIIEKLGELLSVRTDSLVLSSQGRSVTMLGRVWFAADGIILSFYPTEFRQAALQAAEPAFTQSPGGITDTALKMSYDDANYFNQTLSPAGNDVATPAGTVHISNIAVTGADNSMKIAGNVTSAQFPPFNMTVSTGGEDLVIAGITIEPGFSCDGKQGVALFQCRARRKAASVSGNAIALRLTTTYRGRPLRPTGQRAVNKVSLGGKSFVLHTYLVKAHASNDGLYLMGSMSVEGQ